MRIDSLKFSNVSVLDFDRQRCLENIDFDFKLGELVQLKGAPHSGKSLLLQTMALILKINQGNYYINQQAVNKLSFRQLNSYRQHIGYMFKTGGLLANKSLRDNILFAASYHNRADIAQLAEHCDELIEYFELVYVQHKRPMELAASYQRLGGFIRAVLLAPQLLILDRPELGLSAEQIELLVGYIKFYRQQYPEHSLYFCTDIGALKAMATQKIYIAAKKLQTVAN